MTENLLHFIWQNKLYGNAAQYTSGGEKIEIIHPGIPNCDAGPDFTAAKIKIGEMIWSGNVELHVKASDWYRHHHQNDRAYDNVILHVVYEADRNVFVEKRKIPLLQINFPVYLLENYMNLLKKEKDIACEENFSQINSLEWNFWLENLLIERLKAKSEWILNTLSQLKNDWNETFYRLLSRNMGFKTNALPFELLSKSLPLKIIAKHRYHPFQIEALFFGQAGFLEENSAEDEYFMKLRSEYKFLAQKYSLNPLNNSLWKFARMHPPNFPTIRLAQFAQLINKQENLFSKILEIKDITEINKLFDVQISEYWKTHYRFGKITKKREHPIGKQSVQLLTINTIVTALFAYGLRTHKEEFNDFSLEILSKIQAEKNKIVRMFVPLIGMPDSAYQTQALLQLYNEYCSPHFCDKCAVGQKIITHSVL